MARLVALIETTVPRGRGASEEDPIRTVTQWWTPAGELLAESDPHLKAVLPRAEYAWTEREACEFTRAVRQSLGFTRMPGTR